MPISGSEVMVGNHAPNCTRFCVEPLLKTPVVEDKSGAIHIYNWLFAAMFSRMLYRNG